MQGQCIFLGTGGSMGVPVIGCSCSVCLSPSPYNKRLRPSALLKVAGKNFLLDAGVDFREQALRAAIEHLDGVLLTHSHFDHIGGIDDLRAFYFKTREQMPCLLSRDTYEELRIRYPYLFQPIEEGRNVSAQLKFQLLENDFGEVVFGGITWDVVSYYQGNMKVVGYRLGRFAYITDIREYTPEVISALRGVHTLVVSGMRLAPTKVNFSVQEAISFGEAIGAKKTYLTHMSHELEYEAISRTLPSSIYLAYDGLEIPFDV